MAEKSKEEIIGVVGMGYVGLPVAVALANKYENVTGFDISHDRIDQLISGLDSTNEVSNEEMKQTTVRFTSDISNLARATFIIVTVPTPIDVNKRPNLSALEKASNRVGSVLSKGAIVVYESTVYPGVTEDICVPIIERESGMKAGEDFNIGYSPERVNPGDKDHTLEKIVKVVSADNEKSLERIKRVYSSVVDAGLHVAPSIRVAEAAKVIENIQRDLNIALMNELAIIFDLLDIPTLEVLEAAGTKWNFLPFRPGLVGGHCIGVDPFYLTTRAEQAGYHPEVILAGRRINDRMGDYVASKCIKLLIKSGKMANKARVGVLGVTFKENIPDIRNSRVKNLVEELKSYGLDVLAHDPYADPQEVTKEMGFSLCNKEELHDLDAIILTVPHDKYLIEKGWLEELANDVGVILDVKSAVKDLSFDENVIYWRL